MADLKENELTQRNDFNFVRGLDAAGNSILINKSDLVKVLEGLMLPYMHQDFAPINLREAINRGTFGIATVPKLDNDYPLEGADMYGVLLVMTGADLISQLLITTRGSWARASTMVLFKDPETCPKWTAL